MERQEGDLSKEIFGAPEQQNQALICYKGLPWPTEAARCPRPPAALGNSAQSTLGGGAQPAGQDFQ